MLSLSLTLFSTILRHFYVEIMVFLILYDDFISRDIKRYQQHVDDFSAEIIHFRQLNLLF